MDVMRQNQQKDNAHPCLNDVSEAVASGEIKSTGKSMSVDEVIADIDEHFKGESNL